jgi:diacylglycerol kinase family enzyme
LRVTLIHNPEAGDETRPTRGQLEALIKEAGHKVRYQSVKEPAGKIELTIEPKALEFLVPRDLPEPRLQR